MSEKYQMSEEYRTHVIKGIETKIYELYELLTNGEMSLNNYEKLSIKAHTLSMYLEDLVKEWETYPHKFCKEAK